MLYLLDAAFKIALFVLVLSMVNTMSKRLERIEKQIEELVLDLRTRKQKESR